MTDVDRKTKNIVVRCLRPYKGYGLLRERDLHMRRESASTRQRTLALWIQKAHALAFSSPVKSQEAPILRYRPTNMSDRLLDSSITAIVHRHPQGGAPRFLSVRRVHHRD